MEATNRFKLVEEKFSTMIFHDSNWRTECVIQKDISLEELIKWLTTFYAKEADFQAQAAFRNGQRAAKEEIRTKLGL